MRPNSFNPMANFQISVHTWDVKNAQKLKDA